MKKQRAEDQISQSQRLKLIELGMAGYNIADLAERFGIGAATALSIVSAHQNKAAGMAKVRKSIEQRYRNFLMDGQALG
ncbi:hypothetical protein [Rhizobium leguminosarum]|uniref:hypothetical protein n=1 Tax=Rhizobium leguminosarum TaxID=384 RepID=UPI001AE90002|nr:hypothetical protein [Rhizobium leguminosarum]MBP2444842.1 transposase [Rhizobium leguminosarum]